MPTLGVAVTAITKEKFESLALARKLTSSRLAASLINEFLEREYSKFHLIDHAEIQKVEGKPVAGGRRDWQVFVRMDQLNYAELGRLASEKNWYRGTYLANLFHAHAHRSPVLCELEIDAVRQAARHLADTSRSLNLIARKAERSPEHSHLLKSIDFEEIRTLTEFEASAVRDLLKANLREWGVSDVQR